MGLLRVRVITGDLLVVGSGFRLLACSLVSELRLRVALRASCVGFVGRLKYLFAWDNLSSPQLTLIYRQSTSLILTLKRQD